MKFFNKKRKFFLIISCLFVFFTSLILGLHNATLYVPNHGFDGSGHAAYIKYLFKERKIPPPTGYETHQPPFYYVLGAFLMMATKNIKTAQYLNTFVLWLIIGISGMGLKKVFKKVDQTLIGMFALAALPMLNIFPAMLTNELFSTFWIISSGVACLYFISSKNNREIIKNSIWLAISLVLGVWTKISIITILPIVCLAILIVLVKEKKRRLHFLLAGLAIILVFIFFAAPVFIRGRGSSGPTDIVKMTGNIKNMRPPDFYLRLDWIAKVDMYNTQYYSMLGGAWNSFWSDGQNAITPFIAFHKKAFILWSLGFVLFPLSLYGLKKIWDIDKLHSILLFGIGILMFGIYVVYNNISGHYSAARLTYEMGIVLPYSFGIAGASLNKKLKPLIIILLTAQFAVMVSFFWILSWWHVTR